MFPYPHGNSPAIDGIRQELHVADAVVMPLLADDGVLGVATARWAAGETPAGDDAAERADRLLGCFDESFRLEAGEIRIGIRVGIAVHADGDAVAEKLLRTADADLYPNKHLRRAQRRSGRTGRSGATSGSPRDGAA